MLSSEPAFKASQSLSSRLLQSPSLRSPQSLSLRSPRSVFRVSFIARFLGLRGVEEALAVLLSSSVVVVSERALCSAVGVKGYPRVIRSLCYSSREAWLNSAQSYRFSSKN